MQTEKNAKKLFAELFTELSDEESTRVCGGKKGDDFKINFGTYTEIPNNTNILNSLNVSFLDPSGGADTTART